ncbi:TrlF family AAA-like ATPase [Dyella humi]|uniref:AAA family ATPase n=1 Tax=Dyella humi TaxID=1770547 RepID=A0ABW8IEQ2_9GAMM
MQTTKWWKCDLQVASPSWGFTLPAGTHYDFTRPDDRAAFLDLYMQTAASRGIEVLALADHNSGEWIDDIKLAGKRHGIVVFPGCEITTQTGADGAHLLIFGDLDKTSRDFDRLLHSIFGFAEGNPAYHTHGGTLKPSVSTQTAEQILSHLPDGYIAVAPHALSENGMASPKTAKGDIRWKALHHERLLALDPGDCANVEGDGFNARFKRRELADFPCLRDMAFISTSDAYSVDRLGARFTWIRMGRPSIEALRQAFLDHESRVICDWSSKLQAFPARNPNNVRHAWIASIDLNGQLANSRRPLSLSFHPGLNVIIGGRGSGKSTVIAALRQIYSSSDKLPPRIKAEVDAFSGSVFASAELHSVYRIQESQEAVSLRWTHADKRSPSPRLPVTVVSQKELFERAIGDINDPNMSSRSLLALVDTSIGFNAEGISSLDGFGRKLEDARTQWANAARRQIQMESDVAQLPELRRREAILQGQVDAFSAPEVRQRLARIESRRYEDDVFSRTRNETVDYLAELQRVATSLAITKEEETGFGEPFGKELALLFGKLRAISENVANDVVQLVAEANDALRDFDADLAKSAWHADFTASLQDLEAYKEELDAKGLSTKEFSRLQEELKGIRQQIVALTETESTIEKIRGDTEAAWRAMADLWSARDAARAELFEVVSVRSGRLRFQRNVRADVMPWIQSLRAMANLRADAYLDDVPKLADWLWLQRADVENRWDAWIYAMATGDMHVVQQEAQLRREFCDRLSGIDVTVRMKLATLIPDDVVTMQFLRDGGHAENDHDWQAISEGSPGQKTAAMLAFVLHHGSDPLVLDQPEDDLDSEWISELVVKELRKSRWTRQLIVVSHNANIPVLGDAEQVIALENRQGSLSIRESAVTAESGSTEFVKHVGPVEEQFVRNDIQLIMEGGVVAFVKREQKYNNETRDIRLGRFVFR